MRIEITKRDEITYAADCIDIPGSCAIGIGMTEELAVIGLLRSIIVNKYEVDAHTLNVTKKNY